MASGNLQNTNPKNTDLSESQSKKDQAMTDKELEPDESEEGFNASFKAVISGTE